MLSSADRQYDRSLDRRIRGGPVYVATDLLPVPRFKPSAPIYRPSKLPVNDAVIMSDHIDVQAIGSNLNPFSKATKAPIYGDTRMQTWYELPLERPGANEVKWNSRDLVTTHVPSTSITVHPHYGESAGVGSMGVPLPINPIPYSNVQIDAGYSTQQMTGITVPNRQITYAPINGQLGDIPLMKTDIRGSEVSLRQAPIVPILQQSGTITPDAYQAPFSPRPINYAPVSGNEKNFIESKTINTSLDYAGSRIPLSAPIQDATHYPTQTTAINSSLNYVGERIVHQAPISQQSYQTQIKVSDASLDHMASRAIMSVPIQQQSYQSLSNTVDLSQQALREVIYNTIAQQSYQPLSQSVDNTMKAERPVNSVPLSDIVPMQDSHYSTTVDLTQQALREVTSTLIDARAVNFTTQSAVDASDKSGLHDVRYIQTPDPGTSIGEKSTTPAGDINGVRLHATDYTTYETPLVFSEGLINPYPNLRNSHLRHK